MIRKLLNGDIDRVADIWLKTNLKAHYFIINQYWKSNYELVKEMMSQSEVYVYEDDKMIQGFVGISNEYIEGIFVPDALCGLLHIPYSFRDNDRLSGKDSDLCLYTPYEIPLQILLAVSAPRHGFPYEILPLHPVLSGFLQSSCYYSASISTIPHFLINSD